MLLIQSESSLCAVAAVEDDGLYCAEQIIVVGDEPEILSVYPSVLEAI